LHDGLIQNSMLPGKKVSLRAIQFQLPKQNSENLEITFRADATIFDGRFANNGWLQELPKPITKLVWDNAVIQRRHCRIDISKSEIKNSGLDYARASGKLHCVAIWLWS
jgi:hypothetical protein